MKSTTNTPAVPTDVARAFDSYGDIVAAELMGLRELIFATAAETDGVGELTEALRWGEPAYLTAKTRSGSTVRLAPASDESDHDYAMYFICHTNLVEKFRTMFGDTLNYDGDRALVFTTGQKLPADEIRQCITMAQTYHL